jgi:hypothetical protein
MEPLGRSSYGFMKNLTTTLIFFLFFIPLSLASGPRAFGLHLQDRIESCSIEYGLTPSTLLSRKTEELFNQENSLSWETVKAETLNQAQDQTLIELIENNNYKLANKLSLIYLEKGEVLGIRPETDTHHFQVILKLLKSSNLEAQKLSFFLMGYFSPNPFLSKETNLKLAKTYACIGKEKFYQNVISPFFIVFRELNAKRGCPEYAKGADIFDPCGSGGGGSSYGQVSDYMGSVEIAGEGSFDIYAHYENFNDWNPSGTVTVSESGGGPLGLPQIGARSSSGGEPSGVVSTGQSIPGSSENNSSAPSDSNNSGPSVETLGEQSKSPFDKELEKLVDSISNIETKESLEEQLDQVTHEDEEKRRAQKEAILNKFNLFLTPRSTLTLKQVRLLNQLERGQKPARVMGQRLLSDPPSSYTFASEDPNFVRRAQDLYEKVSAIQAPIELGSHPLTKNNFKSTAKALSLNTIEASDQAHYLGETKAAEVGLEIAEMLADVALGLTPGVSIVNDAYSLFYGKHVLFGTELSVTERVFAGVGILTLGGSNWIKHGGKILGKALIRFGRGIGSVGSLNKVSYHVENLVKSVQVLGFKDNAFSNFLSILKNERGSLSLNDDLYQAIKSIKYKNVWSLGKHKDSVKNAMSHYQKHKAEFPEIKNVIEYVEKANHFIKNPPRGTLAKLRENGEELLYNSKSNIFAVKGRDGAPKTMFRPSPDRHGYSSNLDYFNAQ